MASRPKLISVSVASLACALAVLSPGATARPIHLTRCSDTEGDRWEYNNTDQSGNIYVQKSDTRYLTFTDGVSCSFARHWARKMSLGRNNTRHPRGKHFDIFTDGPAGWTCKQFPSDQLVEEAHHQPPVGFDVGRAACTMLVGHPPHRHSIGFSWAPLPLSFDPK
jgi:hypothetical protein